MPIRFFELFLSLGQFSAEHVEFSEKSGCCVTCCASALVFAIFLGKIALDFFELVFDELDKLSRFCLIRIEFLFRTLNLVEIYRNYFSEVDVQTIVVESSEETCFCDSLFLQSVDLCTSRYIWNIVDALVCEVDTRIEVCPLCL